MLQTIPQYRENLKKEAFKTVSMFCKQFHFRVSDGLQPFLSGSEMKQHVRTDRRTIQSDKYS